MQVTYGPKISCMVHYMHTSMQCFSNALAYLAADISYLHKMFMKWTPIICRKHFLLQFDSKNNFDATVKQSSLYGCQ